MSSCFIIQRDSFSTRLMSNSNLTNHRKIVTISENVLLNTNEFVRKKGIVWTCSSFGRPCLHVLVSLASFQVIRRPNDGNDQPSMALLPSRVLLALKFPRPGSLRLATSFSRVFSVRGSVLGNGVLDILAGSCIFRSPDFWTRIDVSIDGEWKNITNLGLSRQFIQCLASRFIIYQIFRYLAVSRPRYKAVKSPINQVININ